jgi:PHD/YefM family antitoxin component YafN of YafNO toxin-antitoxin module
MVIVHPEVLVNRKRQPKAVLLPFAEWGRIMADLEELEDIRAYDRAKARRDVAIPFEQAVRELKKKRAS